MSGLDGAPPRTEPLGVVDAIRLPGAQPLRRAWAGLPGLARAFVALAVADIVLRALGVGGLSLFVDLAQPLTILLILPHLALVLLPVALVVRRPDAASATPLVVAGAIALSLVELLSGLLFAVFPAFGASIGTWTTIHVLAVMGRAGGWVAIALGLGALTRSVPTPFALGLSNLVAFVIAGSTVTSILLTLAVAPADFGNPSLTSQFQLVNALGPLPMLAFAFLARAVVRGSVDLRRPLVATYTATGAILLVAAFELVALVIDALVLIQLVFPVTAGFLGPAFGLGTWDATGMAGVLLAVAFTLGLADPSVRIPHRNGHAGGLSDPEPQPLQWPSPGTEVPVFRAPEPPAAATQQRRPARKPRRGRGKESPG